MRLRGRLLSEISAEDIVSIVDDELSESVELDYKQQLPDSPGARKEIAQDAAALANTRGGVILFGIEEREEDGKKTGTPAGFASLGEIAVDHEIRRLEQSIRDLTDPVLSGCYARAFTISPGVVVLGLGVPRSLSSPHAVSGRYYRRGVTGNYVVDTRELRQIMSERDQWHEEVEEFRHARISLDASAPVPTFSPSTYVQILPLGRLREVVDIVGARRDLANLDPIGKPHWVQRANLDGYLLYWPDGTKCENYSQWFRNGGVEIASSRFSWTDQDGRKWIDAGRLGGRTVAQVRSAVKFMHGSLKLDPPFVVLVSILRTRGATIHTEQLRHLVDEDIWPNKIDLPNLILPGVLIEDPATDVRRAMMPASDMVWQAAGFPDSPLRRIPEDRW